MPARRLLLAALALFAAGCNGGSPSAPILGHDVFVVVFYDETGNGHLDGAEAARVPGVEVSTVGRTAVTEAVTGRAVIRGVPEGAQSIAVRAATLPAFYAAGPDVPVQVPTGSEVPIPVTLPIGGNRPNTYMAFGDSISDGEGSSDGTGYRDPLARRLQGYFGLGELINDGVPGSNSLEGVRRIGASLGRLRPAYTLILYGTNDWLELDCRRDLSCTVGDLREIVDTARAADSLPVLATIIPGNPAFKREVPAGRNQWVSQVDALIRPLAKEEGVPLADLEAAFLAEGDVTQLFSDHVHPNDRGYEIIAREFFRAIARPLPGPTAAAPAAILDLGWRPEAQAPSRTSAPVPLPPAPLSFDRRRRL